MPSTLMVINQGDACAKYINGNHGDACAKYINGNQGAMKGYFTAP